MKKISIQQWIKFERDYYSQYQLEGLRIGQAFYNYYSNFFPNDSVQVEREYMDTYNFYYATSDKAMKIIVNNFIDYSEEANK